eukprot:TRINITY_DN27145_c0_g1_i1.p1 TRINITY_DN27145_c0_g1~~TRINITY_DN27145_c0_g1_i1.p1  ORF type:complete len:252 (+),score=87.99 TRINITY_DN27145_c0_g1_i1:81-836(+)
MSMTLAASAAGERPGDGDIEKRLRAAIPELLMQTDIDHTSLKVFMERLREHLHLDATTFEEHSTLFREITLEMVKKEEKESSKKRRRVDHAEAAALGLFDLWKTRRFADALVKCGNEAFAVHRAVLAMRSPVFAAMFEQDGFKEGAERLITIGEADPKTVEGLLEYIYVGQVPRAVDCKCLLPLAERFEVQGLVDVCVGVVNCELNEENVVPTVRLFRQQRHREAVGKAYDDLVKRIKRDDRLLRAVLEEL